jgi:hypothetical protein
VANGEAGAAPGAPVVATIALTAQDLESAAVDVSWVFRVRKLLLALFVLMVFVTWRGMVHPSLGVLVPQLLVGVGYVAFLFVAPRLAARRQLRVMARAGDTNVTYRFDDEGITIRSAGATSTLAYRRLVKVVQGRTALLLYTTDQVANLVPLRAFSADELARLRAFLPAEAKPKKFRSATRLVILWVALVLVFLVIWQLMSAQAPPKPAPSPAVDPAARPAP